MPVQEKEQPTRQKYQKTLGFIEDTSNLTTWGKVRAFFHNFSIGVKGFAAAIYNRIVYGKDYEKHLNEFVMSPDKAQMPVGRIKHFDQEKNTEEHTVGIKPEITQEELNALEEEINQKQHAIDLHKDKEQSITDKINIQNIDATLQPTVHTFLTDNQFYNNLNQKIGELQNNEQSQNFKMTLQTREQQGMMGELLPPITLYGYREKDNLYVWLSQDKTLSKPVKVMLRNVPAQDITRVLQQKIKIAELELVGFKVLSAEKQTQLYKAIDKDIKNKTFTPEKADQVKTIFAIQHFAQSKDFNAIDKEFGHILKDNPAIISTLETSGPEAQRYAKHFTELNKNKGFSPIDKTEAKEAATNITDPKKKSQQKIENIDKKERTVNDKAEEIVAEDSVALNEGAKNKAISEMEQAKTVAEGINKEIRAKGDSISENTKENIDINTVEINDSVETPDAQIVDMTTTSNTTEIKSNSLEQFRSNINHSSASYANRTESSIATKINYEYSVNEESINLAAEFTQEDNKTNFTLYNNGEAVRKVSVKDSELASLPKRVRSEVKNYCYSLPEPTVSCNTYEQKQEQYNPDTVRQDNSPTQCNIDNKEKEEEFTI